MAVANPHAAAVLPRPMRVAELASQLGATVVGNGELVLERLGHVGDGNAGTLGFFRDVPHARQWIASGCPAAIAAASAAPSCDGVAATRDISASAPWDASVRALLVVKDADAALLTVLKMIEAARGTPAPGVHASAVVDPTAEVDPSATIGPMCVVGAGVRIGARTLLASNVAVGDDTIIGSDCKLLAGARVLHDCTLGNRVIIHPNTVIGADGFGYVPTQRGLAKLPHVGTVVIEDDVEIGANSCVDRAKFGETRIGQGTKIDNLVQIAHNCIVGKHCVLCGQAGLAGGAILGDGVLLGGKVGVADGVKIGSGAKVAAHSGVAHDLAGGESYMGAPAWPAAEWRRIFAAIRVLPRYMSGIRKLSRESGDNGTEV